MPRTPKSTGADLADTVMAEQYDHTYLAAHLAFAVANIVDGNHTGSAKSYGRSVLESLADFDTFVANTPAALKRDV